VSRRPPGRGGGGGRWSPTAVAAHLLPAAQPGRCHRRRRCHHRSPHRRRCCFFVPLPAGYKDLISSFVSILKQITEHRLPRDFDYHRIPAPWIQMKLLRILALLGRADQTASEQM